MALDKSQIVKKVYNATKAALNATSAGATTVPQPTVYLSETQIWKRIFNSTTNKIRLSRV